MVVGFIIFIISFEPKKLSGQRGRYIGFCTVNTVALEKIIMILDRFVLSSPREARAAAVCPHGAWAFTELRRYNTNPVLGQHEIGQNTVEITI